MAKKRTATKSTSRAAQPRPALVEEVPRGPMYLQVATIFTLAIVVRATHFFLMSDSLLYQALICDCGQYDSWAQRIAGGEWIGHEVFYQTPLYPYLLAVIYRVCGHSLWAVRVVQALFGAVACVALARAGARWFCERAGWIAGVLLALYPPAIFFDGILQKASLDLLLMALLLWTVGAAQSAPQLRLLAFTGLLLGAMTLNRENAAALLPVLAAWIAWLSWSQPTRIGLTRGAAFALGLAAVLLPVGLRNYYVGNAFLLTTAQMGPNFYIGNHRGASGGYLPMRAGRGEPLFESEDARLIAEDDVKRPLSSREISRYWMARSWNDITAAPGEWLRLLAWKWFLTWHAIESVDAEAIHTHEQQSVLLWTLSRGLHFGVLCPLAALGLWLTRRDWRRLWLLYAMLAAFAAAVTAFYVFARYRYPLVPVATLFAGAGLVELWNRGRRHTPSDLAQAAIGLALAVAVAIPCNWPLPQLFNDDAITYYNAGSSLLGAGRRDEALALLRQAQQADPTFPETYNNLGQIALNMGELDQARQYFEQGLQADPNYAPFYFNIAVVALKQGDRERALGGLRKAIELDPLLASAYVPLAELEANRGDLDAAVRHLRRAAELQPQAAAIRVDLASTLQAQGHVDLAVRELRAALAIDPNLVPACNRLARLLATAADANIRNGAEAVKWAHAACRATDYREPQLLDTLAAAFAESGQFPRAVETAGQALALAQAAQHAELADAIAAHRQLYREGKALREPPVGRK